MGGGERILLASGERFVGHLALRACGEAEGTVHVSTFGGTERATLSGATSVADLGLRWERVTDPTFNGLPIEHLRGAPLYRAHPVPEPVQQLYSGADRMTLARHPNGSPRDPRYFSAVRFWDHDPAGCLAAACIRGDDSENPTWALRTFGAGPNAFAVVRTSDWSLQRSDIVWYHPDENGFAIADSLRTPVTGDAMPPDGFGFILFNTLPWLDRAGEWYYNPDDQALYFWSPDDRRPVESETHVCFAPRGSLISADFGGSPLDLSVANLRLERSPTHGIYLTRGRSLTVEDVDVHQPEAFGIRAWSLSGSARVDGCTVHQPAATGIHISWVADEIRVTNNTVVDPGAIHNQRDLAMNFNGIRAARQARLTIANNTVYGSGYAGAMIGPATVSLSVLENTFTDYCLLLNDCGGVYFNGTDNTLESDQEISWNTFSGGVGNTAGVPSALQRFAAVGVYLDLGASHVRVEGNRIERFRSKGGGIFLHGGTWNLIRDNTVVATQGPAFGMRRLGLEYPSMGANIVERNAFSTASDTYAVIRFVDPWSSDCSEMYDAIRDDNVMTHSTRPGFLYMCEAR